MDFRVKSNVQAPGATSKNYNGKDSLNHIGRSSKPYKSYPNRLDVFDHKIPIVLRGFKSALEILCPTVRIRIWGL